MANPNIALTRARRACWTIYVVGACAVADATDWVEPRTALDRPGTHHARYVVQLVDDQGRPVAATVSVHGSRGETATTTTDESSHAELRDVSSPDWLFLSVSSSGRLRPQYLPLEGVTNGIADLGVLRLKRNVVITGIVKRVTDGGEPTAVDEGRVSLYAVGDGTQLGFSPVRDGWFRLDDFDVEPMEIKYDDSSWKTPDHRAPLPIDRERHRQHFELFVEPEAGGGGLLRVESRDVPPEGVPAAAEEPTRRIDLRLVDTEGEPIPGSRVRVWGEPRIEPAFTDADGRFSLDTVGVPEQLYVSGPWGVVSFGVESPRERDLRPPDVVADITGQSEIEIPVLRRVELEVTGIDAQGLAYGWRNLSGQWRTADQTLVERMFDDLFSGFPLLLRVDSPGRLPRFAAYPPQGPLVIDFTEDRQLALAVVDEQGPVAGATVDVVEVATPYLDRVAVNDPEADLMLGSMSTDADGRLVRLANPRALYVAYVYAEGYDPARVLLQAGSEIRVELVKRDVMITFNGLSVGELLRVKVAGGSSLVALRRVANASPVVVSLAPGTYDVSVEDADSVIDRGTTLVVGEEHAVVDTTVDRRPELVLRLPELPVVPERYRTREETVAGTTPADRWIVWASRRAPHKHPLYPVATAGRMAGARESPVEVELREEPGETLIRVVRFSGSGRWLVCLASERHSLRHVYFVEVELAAGEEREIRLQPLDASLEGAMAYEGDLERPWHGVVGPRLMLIRAGGADTGWNVVNHLPERLAREGADRDRFVLDDLPAGDYHLFHHLGENSAWGGIEVSLGAGQTTTIPRLGSELRGTWTVDVVDSEGRPIRDQMLRVRDRMLETWEAYWEIPHSVGTSSTGELAADSIPLPPAARLRGEPVSFESIRPGWLELVLDDPDGPARHYLRKADPGSTFTLVVDD